MDMSQQCALVAKVANGEEYCKQAGEGDSSALLGTSEASPGVQGRDEYTRDSPAKGQNDDEHLSIWPKVEPGDIWRRS